MARPFFCGACYDAPVEVYYYFVKIFFLDHFHNAHGHARILSGIPWAMIVYAESRLRAPTLFGSTRTIMRPHRPGFASSTWVARGGAESQLQGVGEGCNQVETLAPELDKRAHQGFLANPWCLSNISLSPAPYSTLSGGSTS